MTSELNYDDQNFSHIQYTMNQLQIMLKDMNLKLIKNKQKSPKKNLADLYYILENFMNKYTITEFGYCIQASDLRKKFNYMCDKNETHVSFSRLMDKYTQNTVIEKIQKTKGKFYINLRFI